MTGPRHLPVEHHLVHRIGWLRAAVLGANDGIISVSSLIVGIAAAPGTSGATILLAGAASLIAGAMSMAAGEFVSVSSQADTEAADLAREATELRRAPEVETAELAAIYETRGLDAGLARQVARQMMAHDALGAHRRDELGLTDAIASRPILAAASSAGAFAAGAIAPVLVAVIAPRNSAAIAVSATALLLLAILGAVGARAGGASVARGALRVTFWGAAAMAATAAIGRVVGATI